MGAWNYLQDLCRLGPRGSATEGERRAAQWIAAKLEELGFDVEIQRFRGQRHTLYLGPSAVIAGMLLARWLAAWRPLLGAAAMIALLVPLVGEMLGARLNFDLILPRSPSQNVIGRLAQRAAGESAGDEASAAGIPVVPVVVSAHYDTQRGTWLFAPWFRPILRPFFVGTYVALALMPAGTVLKWAWPAAGWIGAVERGAAAWLGAALAFLVLSWASGKYVEGANDNGSGVAVALALARRWREEPIPGLAPIFVFTGCEESGLRGMSHFLSTAALPPGTAFVNLDNVGGGRLRYLTGEGMLVYRPYDKDLVAAARQAAAEFAGRVQPLANLLLPTDALAATLAGYPAVTLLAMGDDGGIPNYHWHTDVLAHADRAVVDLTEEYAWRILQEWSRRARD